MTTITAKPLTARPLTARPLTAYRLGESTDVSRWYLHWGGVNQYAQHSAWSMSGFGDRIEFSFVADDPGNGTQKLYEADGSIWYLRINASTGVLRASYSRLSDGAQIVINGPTVTAGGVYTGSVSLNADGAVLLVNGNAYSSAHTPKLSDCAIEYIATNSLINECFPGTIHYLRYVNATALQNTNGVESNGVDITGTIPAITLSSAVIGFTLLYKSGNQTILNGSVPILTVSSDLFVLGANVTTLTIDGVEYASETLVDGQHYDVEIEVDGGTLTTIGLMASGAVMGDLTIEV